MTIEKKPMEESTEQNHVREVEEDESLTEEFEEEEDDSDQDPTFDILEETRSGFSNLSLKKSKSRITKAIDRGSQEEEEGSDDVEVEVKLPELDAKDLKSFENVEKLIAGGQLGKLKVEQCKVYLRKNGLRLTGNKDVLIDRIKEHLGIINGGGEQKYPASSFVLNCKGDACTGDVVMFEQNVYEMYSIASRSATGPPCGTRIVAGRIVKESYGSAKQQHTFTIEVLWSKGVKPLPALHPLLIKGRNLYRLKTLRQLWADEEERRKVLLEKHSRGFVARSNRETRIQEKETRKMLKGQRVTKNKSNVIQDQKKRIQPDPFRTNMSSPPVVQPQKQQKFIDPVIYRTQPQLHPNLIKSENPTILKPNSVIHQNSNVTEQQHNIRTFENLQNGGFQLANNTQNHFSGEVHHQSHDVNVNVTEQHHHHNGVTEVRNHRSNGFHVARSEKAHHSYDANGSSSFNSFPRSPTHGKAPMQWQVCRYYAQGRCHHGENCKYLHEDRGKPVNDERICMSPTRGRAPMQRQVCQYYAQGRCHHGENCKYLHEDRGKPVNDESICMSPTRGRAPMLRQVCQYYAKGRCLYGENCKYLHEVRKERVNDERITAKQSNLGSPPWSPTRRSFNSPTRGSLHSPTHRSINSPPWSPNHGRYPMQQPVRYNAQGGRYMHERR